MSAASVEVAAVAVEAEGGTLIQRLIDVGHVDEEAVAQALLAEGALARRAGAVAAVLGVLLVLSLGAHAITSALAVPRTERATPAVIEGTLVAVGETRSLDERDVAATVLGRLRMVAGEEGTRVEKGAFLFELDRTLAEATVARARARLERARAARDHLQGAALAAARAALTMRRSALAALTDLARRPLLECEAQEGQAAVARIEGEAMVAAAEVRDAAAELAMAEDELGETTVVAPFTGTIVRRHARPGDVIGPSAPVVRLADLEHVIAEVRVPEAAVGALDRDSPSLALAAYPGRTFKGRVLSVAEASSDASTLNLLLEEEGPKTYLARIQLESAPPDLRLGLTVTARLRGRRAEALSVPRSAIFYDAGRRCVRVWQGGVPVVREVRTGVEDAESDRVEVVAGLAAGEIVYLGR